MTDARREPRDVPSERAMKAARRCYDAIMESLNTPEPMETCLPVIARALDAFSPTAQVGVREAPATSGAVVAICEKHAGVETAQPTTPCCPLCVYLSGYEDGQRATLNASRRAAPATTGRESVVEECVAACRDSAAWWKAKADDESNPKTVRIFCLARASGAQEVEAAIRALAPRDDARGEGARCPSCGSFDRSLRGGESLGFNAEDGPEGGRFTTRCRNDKWHTPDATRASAAPETREIAPAWRVETWAEAIREAWVAWAKGQPNPKPSWLVPWDKCDEQTKDADRYIARYLLALYGAPLPPAPSGACPSCGSEEKHVYRGPKCRAQSVPMPCGQEHPGYDPWHDAPAPSAPKRESEGGSDA